MTLISYLTCSPPLVRLLCCDGEAINARRACESTHAATSTTTSTILKLLNHTDRKSNKFHETSDRGLRYPYTYVHYTYWERPTKETDTEKPRKQVTTDRDIHYDIIYMYAHRVYISCWYVGTLISFCPARKWNDRSLMRIKHQTISTLVSVQRSAPPLQQ